jgi:periplasmic divalent cation tolerance protein
MEEFIQVITAIDSQDGAQKIAEALVKERLAACVHVSGPITSTYWWQGKMEVAKEWVLSELRTQSKNGRELSPLFLQKGTVVHAFSPPSARFERAFPTFWEGFPPCPEF